MLNFDGAWDGEMRHRFEQRAWVVPAKWCRDRSPALPGESNGMHPEFAAEIHQLPAERRELVFRVRRQLAEGTYESETNLDLALDRLLDDLDGPTRSSGNRYAD